jgi:hypothetical protein
VAYPGILFGGGGVQKNQLRTEGRENGDLGGDFRDVEGCYGCIFHGTGNSAQLCQDGGFSEGGLNPPNPPGTPLNVKHLFNTGKKKGNITQNA